jgi:transcriptional regulator with XRE-family HTH domain
MQTGAIMVSEKIRLIRENHKPRLSQEALAQLIDSSIYRINKIEQGRREPTYTEIRNLIIRLKLDPYDFLSLPQKGYNPY